jgi:hypothetical protein
VRPDATRGRLLRLGGFLVLALVVGALALAYRLNNPPRPYDQEVRTALADALMHLSQSYAHEKALIESLDAARREFETVIGLLRQAEALEPAEKERIAQIERDLQSLRTAAEDGRIGRNELRNGYQELQSRLERLLREAQ